eukprot:15471529-Alexandrium_andersonii.AAC.1
MEGSSCVPENTSWTHGLGVVTARAIGPGGTATLRTSASWSPASRPSRSRSSGKRTALASWRHPHSASCAPLRALPARTEPGQGSGSRGPRRASWTRTSSGGHCKCLRSGS